MNAGALATTSIAVPAASSHAGRDVTLLDLLDRLLSGGVALQGDITLAVANIDLVSLDLRAVVGAAETLMRTGQRTPPAPAASGQRTPPASAASSQPTPSASVAAAVAAIASAGATTQPRLTQAPARAGELSPLPETAQREISFAERPRRGVSPLVAAPEPVSPRSLGRIDADRETLEKGLAQLVLTLVELLRQLMERQAEHRIDGGTLTAAEIEQLGTTFMLLASRMDELKEAFGLSDEDLNLNLGPLGNLM